MDRHGPAHGELVMRREQDPRNEEAVEPLLLHASSRLGPPSSPSLPGQEAPAVPVDNELPDIVIGGFRPVEEAYTAGQGTIYRAERTTLDGHVQQAALKVCDASIRPQMEADTLTKVPTHPNLVRLRAEPEIDPAADQVYMLLDWIDGDTWEHLDAPLPWYWVLYMGIEAGKGLMHLHAQQPPVLHRDVKPANIMVTSQGDVVVVDLGIAMSMAESERITMEGPAPGTPGFLPLDAQRGQWSERTDIYMLAAAMSCVLTERYENGLPTTDRLPTIVPSEFRALLDHMQETKASARPRSVKECVGRMEGILRQHAERAQVPTPHRKAHNELRAYMQTRHVERSWFPPATPATIRLLFWHDYGYYQRVFGQQAWQEMLTVLREVHPVAKPRHLREAVWQSAAKVLKSEPIKKPSGFLHHKIAEVQEGRITDEAPPRKLISRAGWVVILALLTLALGASRTMAPAPAEPPTSGSGAETP